MCIGSGPEIDTTYQDYMIGESERARADETARQERIRKGMSQIATLFEGGWLGGGSGKAPGVEPYLTQRRADQKAVILPQLDEQRDDAKEGLAYALHRAGTLDSTMAGERQADLGTTFAREKANIMDRIAQDIASQRTSLNQARSSLESSLMATGDAKATTNEATRTLDAFRSQVPDLNPAGNIFAGIATGIGAAKQGAEARRIRALATPPPINGPASRTVY